MAEYGEWNRKGATLSEVTAQSEYGVSREFIIKGIKSGRLEYREGEIWGNPYLRVLKSQVEAYIVGELGADFLNKNKNQAELRKIKSEINGLNKKLKALQVRKNKLEVSLEKANNSEQSTAAGAVDSHSITCPRMEDKS
jgi:flagellar motility protein MotE (MotC chaperone)